MPAISSSTPTLYAERPDWADVIPLAQYENVTPLAPIFYTDECLCNPYLWTIQHNPCVFVDKDATDYFRGIVKTGEMSERVLELTENIIRQNPAHYSAWRVTFILVGLLR